MNRVKTIKMFFVAAFILGSLLAYHLPTYAASAQKICVGQSKAISLSSKARKHANGYYYIGKKKVTFKSSNKNICSINKKTGILTGKRTGSAYIKVYYGKKKRKSYKVLVTAATKTNWVVSKSGDGDFTTVTEAVNYTPAGSTIYIKNGIYDGEMIKAWGKNIHLIGESKEHTIIQNGTNNYYTPPLELSSGSIENLTIYAYDGGGVTQHPYGWLAYAIHIDDDRQFNQDILIKNCIIKCDKRSAIGIGMRKGSLTLDHCNIESRDNSAVYMHETTDSNLGDGQYFNLNSCTLKSSKTREVITFHSERTANSRVYISCINNTFLSDLGNAIVGRGNIATNGTSTNVGTFLNLINFYYNEKACYGNNIAELNFTK